MRDAFVTPGTLLIVAAIVAGVWAILLGTAYAVHVAKLGRKASLVTVTACYLALAAGALLWLGPGARGWLGAAGMLAPFATAVAITIYVRPHPASDARRPRR